MGPGSITRYARPARLWRIGTEPLARIRSKRQNGEGVDALRIYASALSLSYGRAGDPFVSSESPADLRGVPRLTVACIGEAGNVPNPVRAIGRVVCRCLGWPYAVSGFLLLP